MREEMRTVQILVYVADDGTVFRSESDCNEYEAQQKLLTLYGKMFDGNFEPTKDLYCCKYFYPTTKQDIINFIEISNLFSITVEGISSTDPISIYEFNRDENKFENIQEKIKKVKEAKKEN